VKRIKKDYQLALDLPTPAFTDDGLAGLIAGDAKMTRRACKSG
jgi:hypothetical protein